MDATGPPDRPPRLIRCLPGLARLITWCDDGHILAARLGGRDGGEDGKPPDHGTTWETVLVDLEGRDAKVITRDTVWIPGPGLLRGFSPVPR